MKETILTEKIDLLRMQETEINCNLDHSLVSFPGFGLETENNSQLLRVYVYISNKIEYKMKQNVTMLQVTC